MPRAERQQDDLRWCLQSPPLIRRDSTWPDEHWFARLEPGSVRELPVPPHPHHFRLGQHFEKLLAAWLESHEDMQIRSANLQVREGKQTIGEFDFLVDMDGATWHWEAAVKFYLGTGNRRSMSAWYGPNTADRFDLKFERLVTHQLQLADHGAARETLDRLGIRVGGVLCFMKGRLFYPWEDYHAGCFDFPDEVNPLHEKGWWIPADRFGLAAPRDRRYVLLRKIDWLSPIRARHEPDSMCFDEVLELLNRSDTEQATHLAMLDDKGDEISRGFVVTDRWIERASSPTAPGGV